jgi:uncharacterized protein YbjT (DUF2867 family)
MTILAVGAAGKFAGLVIPALARRGARVRGFIHKPEDADQVRNHGAIEVVVGDLRDRASLDTALRGIEAVFYIPPAFLTDEADVGKGVVEAARKAGVRRFVFSSVIHPVLTSLVNHAAKVPVEEAVLDSGLEYTFLHPTLYYQNYARLWPRIVETGVLAEPWSAETRFSRVDYRDVAEVAAIALTENRLLYGTFELCASGILNRRDVAALIGDVLRRKIEVGQADAGDDAPKPLKAMFEHYNHHGVLGSPVTLRAILGREPRTLRGYFEELAAGGKSPGQ